MISLRLAAFSLLLLPTTRGAYNLIKSYEGSSFFDNWAYYGSYDNLTNGDIIWANASVADSNPQLTYINSGGHAIIKVDNTTTVPYNDKRNSVRLTSNDKIGLGSLIMFDTYHVPYGCSVWGALWTKAVGSLWPAGGEIDIFEAVNLQTTNQMALHTQPGCSHATTITTGSGQTGTTGQTACDNNSTNGAGCTVLDANTASYGAPFAAAEGGVWAMELASTGINIWFIARGAVPSTLLTASTLDTSTLGTPSASWPASSCNPSQFFDEQEIVIDITLCGDWAGLANILDTTGCPALVGTNTCYTTYVLDPANYDNAYFEIGSVKLFGSDATAVSTVAVASGTSTTTAAGGSKSTNGAGRIGIWKELFVSVVAFICILLAF